MKKYCDISNGPMEIEIGDDDPVRIKFIDTETFAATLNLIGDVFITIRKYKNRYFWLAMTCTSDSDIVEYTAKWVDSENANAMATAWAVLK